MPAGGLRSSRGMRCPELRIEARSAFRYGSERFRLCSVYKVWDLKNYTHLYSISGACTARPPCHTLSSVDAARLRLTSPPIPPSSAFAAFTPSLFCGCAQRCYFSDKDIHEIKISPGIMLLIYNRSPSHVPLKILSIETGNVPPPPALFASAL
jgi:hypothetical protein